MISPEKVQGISDLVFCNYIFTNWDWDLLGSALPFVLRVQAARWSRGMTRDSFPDHHPLSTQRESSMKMVYEIPIHCTHPQK
jgi:hypothetical protein